MSAVFGPEPPTEPPEEGEPCVLCGEYDCSCYERTEPEDVLPFVVFEVA